MDQSGVMGNDGKDMKDINNNENFDRTYIILPDNGTIIVRYDDPNEIGLVEIVYEIKNYKLESLEYRTATTVEKICKETK